MPQRYEVVRCVNKEPKASQPPRIRTIPLHLRLRLRRTIHPSITPQPLIVSSITIRAPPKMSSPTSEPDQLVIALLDPASTTHRLSILNDLLSNSPFELVCERSLRLTLPEDDALLRAFLAHEIETDGEAETLLKWALKMTAATSFFCVLQLKPSRAGSVYEVFRTEYAPRLWEKYGEDEVYVSPSADVSAVQARLLFPAEPANAAQGRNDEALVQQLESASIHDTHMAHTSSGSGTSTASTGATSANSAPAPTKPTSTTSTPTTAGGGTFKARPIPLTVKSRPSIEPRLSRAAALRMGVPLDSPVRPTKPPLAATTLTSTAASGTRVVQSPASLRAPAIAPRLNKAAVARQSNGAVNGVVGGAARVRREVDFSSTPGHKRMSLVGSTPIASIAPPAIQPRQNRASMGRINGSTATTSTSASTGTGTVQVQGQGHRRTRTSLSTITAGGAREMGGGATGSGLDQGRAQGHRRTRTSLSTITRPPTVPASRDPPSAGGVSGKENLPSVAMGHKRQSTSFSLASLKPPAIAPRLNKAAGARIGAVFRTSTQG